jgi:hypothetical protein
MSAADLKTELGLIAESDLAELRDVQVSRLRNERSQGGGPPFTRIGKTVFYPIKGLRDYLAKQAVVPSRAATLIDGKRAKSAT